MIVNPKIRGFICTTAHPTGCAAHVQEQIHYVKQQKKICAPKRILIIGASTGYGLATRITAAFGANAKTIGVFLEKKATIKRTASAGWYNSVAFKKAAQEAGLYAKSINGDAFSNEIKQQVIDLIRQDWCSQVDLIIYSLASPRRYDPIAEVIYYSVLKPLDKTYFNKTVNILTGEVSQIEIKAATSKEIFHTEKVMGGEDWALWIEALKNAKVLAKGVSTVAYSYIGPEITYPIYRQGTIGKAKKHLELTAKSLTKSLALHCQGNAFISVNKGVVTQASAAIPVVPLYISLLYKVMKGKGTHEGCIEQIYRLFTKRLFTSEATVPVDEHGRIRMDDWELDKATQSEVKSLWENVSTDNLEQISDIKGYRKEFFKLFGFKINNVDYEADLNIL